MIAINIADQTSILLVHTFIRVTLPKNVSNFRAQVVSRCSLSMVMDLEYPILKKKKPVLPGKKINHTFSTALVDSLCFVKGVLCMQEQCMLYFFIYFLIHNHLDK